MTANPSASPSNSRIERCDDCERDTYHEVSIELVETHTERTQEKNQKFAHSACRVSQCLDCGVETRALIGR